MTRIPSALLRSVGGSRPGVSPFILCSGFIGAEYDTISEVMGCLRALLSFTAIVSLKFTGVP